MKKLLAVLALVFCLRLVSAQITPGPIQNYLQPAPADPSCVSAQYWLVAVTTNQWRVCFNGTISNLGGSATGTVTSVAATGDGTVLSATVTGSPITTSGTLAFTLANAGAGTLLNNPTGSAAAPIYTATPTLGLAGTTAGKLVLANGAAAFSSTIQSGATANNTVALFAAVPAANDLFYCAVASTTCTLTDAGYAFNAIPGADISGAVATATAVANALTLNNSNSGAASGTTYNGSAAVTLSANTLGAGSLANANTWSAAQTISAAGAASTSPLLMSGAILTGGTGTTNFPALFIQPTAATAVTNWSTSGTALGINTASGFTGNFFDMRLNGGSAIYSGDRFGNLVAAGSVASPLIASLSNNTFSVQNTAATIKLYNAAILSWSSTASYGGANDVGLDRSAANVIEVNLGTAAGFGGSLKATGFIGASYQQSAASATAGTCAMSTGTTCTITLGHTYTTPVCIATQQSGTLTGASVGCTVSGTTVTVTAAVANSETWGAWVFGNPT